MQCRILHGDCRKVLRDLPDESVHCVVTSPPYWGLRDYGTSTWEGGSSDCDHKKQTKHQKQGSTSARKGRANVEQQRNENFQDVCGQCGARRVDKGIGLERTFDEHLANLVAVFREVRRVLRSDGTLWLNYGDAYNAYNGGAGPSSKLSKTQSAARPQLETGYGLRSKVLKPKDLMMMPARVAMALQADGWWLRSEIIWHKPNPMPESVTDRPTNAHEKLFLLTKSARYFYDAEAVRVPLTIGTTERIAHPITSSSRRGNSSPDTGIKGFTESLHGQYSKPYAPAEDTGKIFDDTGAQDARSVKSRIVEGVRNGTITGANLRNVWTIPTHSYKDAHFATFPPKLVEPCIKAGTSERGVCGECGAPWTRQVETSDPGERLGKGYHNHADDLGRGQRGVFPADGRPVKTTTGWAPTCCDCHVPIMTPVPDGDVRPDPTMQTGRKGLNRERNTNATRAMTRGEQRDYARQIRESENREQIRDLAGDGFDHYVRTDQSGARPLPPDVLAQCIERGWLKPASAQCDCACKDAGDPVPAVVLDCFAGSGTVGQVALSHGRSFIGVEINPEYVEMGKRRTDTVAPLFRDAPEGKQP